MDHETQWNCKTCQIKETPKHYLLHIANMKERGRCYLKQWKKIQQKNPIHSPQQSKMCLENKTLCMRPQIFEGSIWKVCKLHEEGLLVSMVHDRLSFHSQHFYSFISFIKIQEKECTRILSFLTYLFYFLFQFFISFFIVYLLILFPLFLKMLD